MAVLWPWIGEVEVDFLNLARRKIFVNIFGVHAQEKKIVALELLAVVQRTHQNAGIFLDADIIDLRILTCHFQNEFALTHADFDVNRMIIVEIFGSPFSSVISTIGTVGLDRVFVF